MLTLETKEQLKAATDNSFVMFVPNKLSVGEIIISPGIHSKLYEFLNEYFFGWNKGTPCFKPYAWAGTMLEEIEEETFDDGPFATADDETLYYNTIQEFLKTVIDNYGEDTIVVCSYYQ